MAKEKPMKYAIDIPNSNDINDVMVTVEYFPTKKEAIDFAMQNLGADEKGNINVISKLNN